MYTVMAETSELLALLPEIGFCFYRFKPAHKLSIGQS